MRKSVFAGVVVWLFFWVLPNFGQVITGTISGMVTDSTGAAIPDAQVVVLNEDTGVARTVVTDAGGRYSAPQLSLGRFRVTTTKEGFQAEARSGIQLTVGREAVVNIQLQVGQVTQTVEVTGEAPLVQTTDAAVGYLVDDRTITELPLNGRDISQLMLLNPGVVQNQNGKWGNSDKGFGKRFSISGMRGEDNSYLLDGSYINDYYRHVPAGPSGALTGIETVREFQMLTNSFSASYGRAMGGVFNAVTKSGSNEWHGSAYEFLRRSALDARNFFDRGTEPPPFRRDQFGATFGGPVFRDKTFFFVAYEGLRESLTESSFAVVPDLNARQGCLPVAGRQDAGCPAGFRNYGIAPAVAPFLRRFPEPSPQGTNFGNGTQQYFFTANTPTREDFGQGRMDHQISDSDSLFGRFTGLNAERSLFRQYPDRFEVGGLESRLFTLSETHIFSPRLLNTTRFSFNRVIPRTDHTLPPPAGPEEISVPGQPDGAGIEVVGTSAMSGTEGPGTVYTTNRFALNNDLNLTMGNHALQFGGMFERLQYNPTQPFRPYGEWRFSNLADFLQGVPDRLRGTPPELGIFGRGIRQWFLALYLQDDWRVTPNLTVNLGLRWEPYTVPTEVNGLIDNQRNLSDAKLTIGDPYWKNQSWTNFSPRIGFAWSPGQSGRTSVRGGFGIFYVPIDSAVYTVAMVNALSFSPRSEVDDPEPALFPNALPVYALAQSTPGTQTIFGMMFDKLDSPHAVQYSLNVQQQIGESNVVTLGYSGRRGLNLPSLANYNAPLLAFDGVSLALPPNATRLNPAYLNINYVSTGANSWYNGLSLSLQRRFSAGLQAQVSYTYARAISETDGTDTGNHVGAGGGGSLRYVHDRSANRGLSGYQVQNGFTANYSYDLPFGRGATGLAGRLISGWQMTGILTLQDGGPFSLRATLPRALTNLAGGGSPNLVPGFTPKEIIQDRSAWADPTPGKGYFTFDAFTPPGPRQIGNFGRNALIGPGMVTWDFGLTKNTQLGERYNLQFRTEVFNLPNRVNFAQPGQRGNTSGPNDIFNRTGARVPTIPVIGKTATFSRQIQFGLRLAF